MREILAYQIKGLRDAWHNGLFCGEALNATDLAIIGQKAENRFFGKPCGLMDQMASAWGGIIAIDFQDPAAPVVKPVEFDFAATIFHMRMWCLPEIPCFADQSAARISRGEVLRSLCVQSRTS